MGLNPRWIRWPINTDTEPLVASLGFSAPAHPAGVAAVLHAEEM